MPDSVAGRPFWSSVILGVDLFARQQTSTPEAVPLSAAVLAKLPQDWRDVAKHVKAIDPEQQRFLKLSDVALRQTIARILIRSRAAEGLQGAAHQ